MYKKGKNQKGITLIALVITIIVMLILVGVTISMSVNGGLFDKAGEAVAKTNNALLAEQQLAEGGITIGDKNYASIEDYFKVPTAENLFGVWIFNEKITFPGEFYQSVNFVSAGNECTSMDNPNGDGYLSYWVESGPYGYAYCQPASVDGWLEGYSEEYKTVDFGTEGQEVTPAFFTWLSANATYQK